MSEFRSRLRGALKTYENSAIFLEDDGHWSLNSKDKRKALSFLMRAKGSLIIYWLSDNEEKEISDALLSDSIQLGEKSLKICEELGMAREAAKGYAHLVSCLLEQLVSTKPDRQFLVSLTEKGVHHCQKGIEILSTLPRNSSSNPDDKRTLCKLYYVSSWLATTAVDLVESEISRANFEKIATDHWAKSGEILADLDDPSLEVERFCYSPRWGDATKLVQIGNRLLQVAEQTRNNLLIGFVHATIMYGLDWNIVREEDHEILGSVYSEIESNFQRAMESYGRARAVEIFSYGFEVANQVMAGSTIRIANRKFNFDPDKKAELLDRAIEIAKASEFLEKNYPYFAGLMFLIYVRAVQFRVELITNPDAKRK